MKLPHKRLLIKLSGEALLGEKSFGISEEAAKTLGHHLKEIQNSGHELLIVIGGGNIFRGLNLKALGMERTPADHMGMLATLMNGIALQEALKSVGAEVKLMSAIECPKIAETYNWEKANSYLKQGNIVIFVGGTGSPYFTTDTAAALKASEMKVDLLLKATKVNGVYAEDPKLFPEAPRYEEISYQDYLAQNLKVMDGTAVALCMSNHIPIFVFSMENLGKVSIRSLLIDRKKYGTIINSLE